MVRRMQVKGWAVAALVATVAFSCKESPKDEPSEPGAVAGQSNDESGGGEGATGGVVARTPDAAGSAGELSTNGGEGGAAASPMGGAGAGVGGAAEGPQADGDAGAGSAIDGKVLHREALYGAVADDEAPIIIAKASIMGKGVLSRLAVAEDGSIYAMGTQTGRLSKFSAALTELWHIETPKPAPAAGTRIIDLPLNDMVLTADGGIAVTGALLDSALVGHTSAGDFDAVIGKLSATGEQLWADQWGTSNRDAGQALLALSDGSLIQTGACFGQAPGNPPASAGGLAFAKYAADGSRSFIKQTKTPPSMSNRGHQISRDSTDDFYVLSALDEGNDNDRLAKMAPDGTELWRIWLRYRLDRFEAAGPGPWDPALIGDTLGGVELVQRAEDGESLPRYFSKLAVSTDDSTVFLASDERYSNNAEVPDRVHLSAVRNDGKFLWFRQGGVRTAVLDAIEGVTWTGQFKTISELAVDTDAIYLAGTYANTYVNGAVPRPATWPAFVARYDLNGEQVWFKQFSLEGVAYGGVTPTALAIGADGDPIVAFSAGGYRLVRLRASDGATAD